MKYAVGDYLVFIEEVGDCSEDIFTYGQKYIIEYVSDTQRSVYVTNDQGEEWQIEKDAFDLIKKEPPKNDIEWLDRIQQNFKEI